MRVSCLQENLAKGLSIVSRAVSSRSTLPVLGNILLEAKDGQLRLAATNLEIGINCWIGAKVEDEGSTTIPAKLLSEFVNSLPAERIDMELTVRTQTLHLRCAQYDANMRGIDAAEFPIIPTADGDGSGQPILEGSRITLETDGLRKMVDQVVFAAATNESRPTLTGVEVSIKPDRLAMAATDGFRLSVRSVLLENELGEELTVIVPAKSLGELGRISAEGDSERPIDMIVTEARNQILFRIYGKPDTKGSFQRVDLVSQLIDARFPDYRAIVPKSYDTRTVVDTISLLKAVRVANLFARSNNNIIRVAIDPGQGEGPGSITLQAKSSEMGDSVNALDAMVEGIGIEIAFNAQYLIDVLSQIDQSQVVLETTQSTRPGALRPVGMGPDEFLHVVMPMHLPNA
ncbi:MAG: DNA polymerase III subunit beta [Caldilineaceae bacterium]|nr:DNA polymerase III subunit beta [Caldilineaceae bacterium]MBP9072306.1 DNA polymerase III subunit beta [Caldilineaceae bacterium]